MIIMVFFNLCLREGFFSIGQKREDVGSGSDALIQNLHVISQGPVTKLVLDIPLKMLASGH